MMVPLHEKGSPLGIYVLSHSMPDDVARAIIEDGRQKQSFYIFNVDEAFRRIHWFHHLLPRVKIFYAMKTNSTEAFLNLCVATGIGFNCASPVEIFQISQLNVNPKSIFYSMPSKTPDQMKYARDAGVRYTAFDSTYELHKLKENWAGARLLIRIRMDDRKKLEQFGCDFETEARDLLNHAASLQMRVTGVTFHVDAKTASPKKYVRGLQLARALFDHEARCGRVMNIVSIEGGFLGDRADRIDEISVAIEDTLQELFPDPSVQIITDPGRFICDSAFKLYCSISGVRRVIEQNKPLNMIYLNEGCYGTMRYTEDWNTISKFKRPNEPDIEELEDTILWGWSCDSLDHVMADRPLRLPPCMMLDWLVVDNHGAYTFSYATKFSSLGVSLIRPVVSEDLWSILRTKPIFDRLDFVLDPILSTPLPSTLPALVSQVEGHQQPNTPILKM